MSIDIECDEVHQGLERCEPRSEPLTRQLHRQLQQLCFGAISINDPAVLALVNICTHAKECVTGPIGVSGRKCGLGESDKCPRCGVV